MRLTVGSRMLFVLTAALALAVAAGIGWTRYVALEAPVSQTATVEAPANARGLRITPGRSRRWPRCP
ncbi:MAG: hypothetical protein HZY73_14870 [Micropruina sp.]|nr:MAG: hypothetical protein HZY73_14870 [Micropruina sp.]